MFTGASRAISEFFTSAAYEIGIAGIAILAVILVPVTYYVGIKVVRHLRTWVGTT